MSEGQPASGRPCIAPANYALQVEPDSGIWGALKGRGPASPRQLGQEAKTAAVNTQPALGPLDRLGGEGKQGPLGIHSVALRANKTSVMMRVSLLDGWQLNTRTPGFKWSGCGCGVKWQGQGTPDRNAPHEAVYCWGLS